MKAEVFPRLESTLFHSPQPGCECAIAAVMRAFLVTYPRDKIRTVPSLPAGNRRPDAMAP